MDSGDTETQKELKRGDCIEIIKTLIPDKEVRNFIFCGDCDDEDDTFLTSKGAIPRYYGPLINLVFAYVYSIYREWAKDNGVPKDSEKNTNFSRIIKSLSLLYGTYDVSFELMENILLDYYLDCSMAQLIDKTLKLDGINLNNNFSKYAYISRMYRCSNRVENNLTLAEQRQELIDFIMCFPFLRDLKIELKLVEGVTKSATEDSELLPFNKVKHVYFRYDNIYSKKYKGKLLDTYDHLLKIRDEYYYLERMEVHVDNENDNLNSLLLNYTQVGDYSISRHLIVEDEDDGYNNIIPTIRGIGKSDYYYYYIVPGTDTLAEGSKILKDLHAINYRYVRNLALALSDGMNETSKNAFKNTYGKQYPEFFDENDGKCDWDKILSIIIIKENVNNILKTIFEVDPDSYEDLLDNLETRFGMERINSDALKSTIKIRVNAAQQMFDKKTPLLRESRVNSNKAEIKADIIIDALAKAVNNNCYNDQNEYKFPLEMKGRMDYLQDMKDTDANFVDRVRTLRYLVRSTFMNIIAFYEGLLEMADTKREFDYESYYKMLTSKQIAGYQDAMKERFITTVDAVAKELKDPKYESIDALMQRLKVLCLSCETENGEQTPRGKKLKDLIGRSSVMEFGKVKDIPKFLSNISDNDELSNAITRIQNAFAYLAKGSTSKQKISSIYPYVGTYEYTNYGKDGFKVERFVLFNEKMIDVEVLTEFSYKIGNRYFILPNISRSSETIWIDPIIIGIEDFDLNMTIGEE